MESVNSPVNLLRSVAEILGLLVALLAPLGSLGVLVRHLWRRYRGLTLRKQMERMRDHMAVMQEQINSLYDERGGKED